MTTNVHADDLIGAVQDATEFGVIDYQRFIFSGPYEAKNLFRDAYLAGEEI